MGLESLVLPLYELYWLLTTRHLTANIFSCIPIFLDNDFCKTINLFIIDIYASCSIYLEEKAPVKNKQTSINKNNHVNMKSVFSPSVLDFPSVIWLEVGSYTDLKCWQPGPLFMRVLRSQNWFSGQSWLQFSLSPVASVDGRIGEDRAAGAPHRLSGKGSSSGLQKSL